MKQRKAKQSDIGLFILKGNLVAKQPVRQSYLRSRYPGTMSDNLVEHILSWLNGNGQWKDSKGVFRNW